MSDLPDFLGRIVAVLDELSLKYMLAGSFASTYHGHPRTTQDVDVVIELTPAGLDGLLARLPDDAYYVSADAAQDALRRQSQFNVIDLASGWKADFIIKKRRPFSQEELGRRERAHVLGVDVWVASAEDTIVSKLEWSSKSGSDRQLDDVRGILAARGDELDTEYIARWARDLGVLPLWLKVKDG